MSELREFLRDVLDHEPKDLGLFERALTHSSVGKDSYERLEFLGDRVIGIAMARWLYERFENEPEGKLSRRYNVLVSRETCGEIGRQLGLPALIRLGNQAREEIAQHLGRKVHLYLHVKVNPRWDEDRGLYKDIGLEWAD